MPKTTTWNIHNPDGRYLGQSEAFAAHTAFCRYMAISGTQFEEGDVLFEAADGDSGQIKYRSEEFVLTTQN